MPKDLRVRFHCEMSQRSARPFMNSNLVLRPQPIRSVMNRKKLKKSLPELDREENTSCWKWSAWLEKWQNTDTLVDHFSQLIMVSLIMINTSTAAAASSPLNCLSSKNQGKPRKTEGANCVQVWNQTLQARKRVVWCNRFHLGNGGRKNQRKRKWKRGRNEMTLWK